MKRTNRSLEETPTKDTQPERIAAEEGEEMDGETGLPFSDESGDAEGAEKGVTLLENSENCRRSHHCFLFYV